MASSQTQTANPNSENKPQMEQEEEQRNWADLSGDLLMVIFQMVGIIDVLKSVGAVCRSWRKVAKDEPDLWRRIDMTLGNHGYRSETLKDLTKLAIDWSRGRLEEFSIDVYCDDDLLQYLCDRTSMLKSLRLISCCQVSDHGLVETVKKQPLLEELEIKYRFSSYKLPELVGKELPNLKEFKLNSCWYFFPYCCTENVEAFGIAKTMHELRSLELIRNRLTNEGLKAILEGCPHLETLDIGRCYNVKMDSDMRARCARLTTFILPDSLDEASS